MRLIQVLGTGCPRSRELADNAQAAIRSLGIAAAVERVNDPNALTHFGVLMTPALAIDGEVKVVGRVPGTEEIAALLKQG